MTTLAPWLTPSSATSSTESSSTRRRGRPTTSSTRPPARSTPPRPMSGAEDVDRAYARRRARPSRPGATPPRPSASARCSRSPTRSRTRAEEFIAVECKNTGKPIGAHDRRRRCRRALDQIRFFAGAARVLEGKSAGEYMDGPHLLRPPRADRRRRPGDAVELPADDDDLEDRARRSPPATPSCSSPATPRRPRPTLLAEMCQEFLPPGVLNVVCGDRDTGRALVEHPTPQMVVDHRLGARRHGGRRSGGRRTSSACTSSSAARRR